jgi:phage tail sheath protein FI
MQWVVFEPNVPSVWKTVQRNVTQFLMDLWRRGWFQGDTPEDGFYVKCDEETNPPAERNAGRLTIQVGVAPVRPAEFLTIQVAQEMQGRQEGG